ncbi:Ribosome biogenesis protein BRX1-like protein [Aphelenchoides fujianensis]|nr:Ribosome biogenesis protein BRX1-like protein [Aphelenchoides fujianensis]
MVETAGEKTDETPVLVIANNFGDAAGNEQALRILELTLDWICSVQRGVVYVASSPLDEAVADEIKRKWKSELKVEILQLKNCQTFGDVMREVEKTRLIKREFVLIDSVPAIAAAHLNSSLLKYKTLRKADKNNVMLLVCTQSIKSRFPYVLERDTNRLLTYNSEFEEVSVVLTKKDFAAGRIVRSDLKPSGIFVCGEEILAQFSDDFDTHTLDYQIRNVLEHEEILCQQIHVDVHPFGPPFAQFDAALYAAFVPLDVEQTKRKSCVAHRRTKCPPQCDSPSHRGREHSFNDNSRESSPDASTSIWPCSEQTAAPKARKSPRSRRRKLNSTSSSVASASSSVIKQAQRVDVVYETTAVGLQRFDEEVAESMRNSLEAEEWASVDEQNKLIVEINSSKLAYNISMENVTKHIFLAFMQQPKFGPSLKEMKQFTLAWMHVWKNYYKNNASKVQILHAIEEHAVQATEWAKYVPNFIVFLYNEADELVTEECAFDWYEGLPEEHPLRTPDLKKRLLPLVVVMSSTTPRPTCTDKDRVLILCSRGVLARTRHLMKDFKDLLPHTRAESKFEKSSKLADLNEMAELDSCTRCLYFENRKKRDSYLWAADVRGGASVKFLLTNIHTMRELKMAGNCLKGSRPILSFDPQFDKEPHLQVIKEIFKHTFKTPQYLPKSKPFIDHVFNFSLSPDGRIWFRNFQLVGKGEELQEVGPRMVLEVIKVFGGSFEGEVLYENTNYVSPNVFRRQIRLAGLSKFAENLVEDSD